MSAEVRAHWEEMKWDLCSEHIFFSSGRKLDLHQTMIIALICTFLMTSTQKTERLIDENMKVFFFFIRLCWNSQVAHLCFIQQHFLVYGSVWRRCLNYPFPFQNAGLSKSSNKMWIPMAATWAAQTHLLDSEHLPAQTNLEQYLTCNINQYILDITHDLVQCLAERIISIF